MICLESKNLCTQPRYLCSWAAKYLDARGKYMSHTYTMNWLSVIFPHDERTGVKKNGGIKGKESLKLGM